MTCKPCILHISNGTGIVLKVAWGCQKTILQSLAGSFTWKRVNYTVLPTLSSWFGFYSDPNLKIPFVCIQNSCFCQFWEANCQNIEIWLFWRAKIYLQFWTLTCLVKIRLSKFSKLDFWNPKKTVAKINQCRKILITDWYQKFF